MSEGWPQHRGLRPLLFSNSGVGSFTSHKNRSVKVLWDGTYGFSSLSEKTRKSNHLQMSLQRQHFLLSYLKTLSVGPAGVWTRDLPLGRPALSQLSQPDGLFSWSGPHSPDSLCWSQCNGAPRSRHTYHRVNLAIPASYTLKTPDTQVTIA